MTYSQQLEATKENYPFAIWQERSVPDPEDEDDEGMDQYSKENCDRVQLVFDTLISNLAIAGPEATEEEKLAMFKTALLSINSINNEIEDLIETGEREDLCALIDEITIAASLNPTNYGNGEGIADMWRNW